MHAIANPSFYWLPTKFEVSEVVEGFGPGNAEPTVVSFSEGSLKISNLNQLTAVLEADALVSFS